MKYSEAKSRIKDLLEAKYGDGWSDHYRIEEWESAFVLSKRNDESQLFSFVLWVSEEEQGWIGTKNLGRSEKALADICMKLALTPLEEREEEKNYVIKVWDRSNPLIIVKSLGADDFSVMSVEDIKQQAHRPNYRVAFAQKEIDHMKDIISLNIDWDKAVEEYDGEI